MGHYEYMVIDGDKPKRQLHTFKWTTEPPTAEGFYWVRVRNNRTGETETDMQYLGGEHGYTVPDLSSATHWLGPLPVPEPPYEDE